MKKALISTQELVNRRDGKTECRVAQVEPADKIFDVAEGLFWADCDDDVVADRFTYNLFTKAITAIPVPASNSGTPVGNAPNVIA
jgi:hypothetical protein